MGRTLWFLWSSLFNYLEVSFSDFYGFRERRLLFYAPVIQHLLCIGGELNVFLSAVVHRLIFLCDKKLYLMVTFPCGIWIK